MNIHERRCTKKLIGKGFHLFQVGVEGVERTLIRRPFRRGGGGIGRLPYTQPHEAGCGSLLRTAAGHLILDAFWQLAADTFNETDGALLGWLVVKAEAIGNVGIVELVSGAAKGGICAALIGQEVLDVLIHIVGGRSGGLLSGLFLGVGPMVAEAPVEEQIVLDPENLFVGQ